MNQIFTHRLDPAERAEAIKFGMMVGLVANGIPPVSLTKRGTAIAETADLFTNTIPRSLLSLALITGVPIGTLAHVLDRSAAPEQQKQREALERIKYYKDVGREMEGRLAEDDTQVK